MTEPNISMTFDLNDTRDNDRFHPYWLPRRNWDVYIMFSLVDVALRGRGR